MSEYKVKFGAGLDHEYMGEALRLAANGAYDTKPNPAVGCVIVDDHARVVGRGWTKPPGGLHAERVALEEAGAAARGATVYSTLEPCSHFGRTSPCTKSLIEAGVRRVVFAASDPNPVAGGGARALEAAGIEVQGGVLEQDAEPLNRGFFARMRRGRPWVRCKIAASLDGRTALANGASRWITGAAARADVHRWRARSGAVLTGSGTVLADDPSLTARRADAGIAAELGIEQPLRAIVDSRLRTPPGAKTLAQPGTVIVFTTAARDGAAAHDLAAAGARIEAVAGAERCDLHEVIARLAALDVNDVWVEAGPGLNGALLQAGLIDELIVYMAPRLLGAGARGMFAVPQLEALDSAWTVTIDDFRKIGDDLRITGRPIRVASA